MHSAGMLPHQMTYLCMCLRSAEQGLTLVVLSNNLTLIISCLWALANAFIFAAPLWYAITYASSGRTYDSQRSISGHGAEHGGRAFLSFWSFTTLVVVAVCAAIVAAACVGLGTGFLAYQVCGSLAYHA